ncbi:MAG TPA: SPOR domain-containing protein [Candidatus Kapabacteria bacterium]|nr:SPOR domain-containing protein [Candidatus Kapabacteria bacterium]
MSDVIEGEKRYNFSFSRAGVIVLMVGYGLLCFLFCGFGIYIGYDYAKQQIGEIASERAKIEERPSSVVGETEPSVPARTFISLESQSTDEQQSATTAQASQQQQTAAIAQPSQQQQMTAQTMQQSLPDSMKKVVNFRMNSTSVAKDSTTALPASKLRDTWEIQVAAVSKLDGAEKLVQDWKKKGVTMFIVTITGKSGKKWYIVRTGRYDSKEKADAAAATFSKKLGLETIARPYGVF